MTRRIWIAIVVVIAAAAAYLFYSRRARAPEYRTDAVSRGDIVVRVSATGNVTPVTEVEVGSQVSGTVQAIYADYNDHVAEGDLLLQIDPSTFRAQLSQADANAMKAQVALDDANRALKRAQEMRAQGLVSEEALETAQSTQRQAVASLEQAQAARDLAAANLRYTTIRAPLSGFVVSRNVDVGQTVAASLQAPKLFVIANDLTEMQVETQIDEADIGEVREGDDATFTVDAYPDESFHGTVAQVRFEPVEQENVITYTTIIHVKNPDLKLKPGMTANVTVVVNRLNDVLKIPNAALRFRPKGAAPPGGARGASGDGVAGRPSAGDAGARADASGGRGGEAGMSGRGGLGAAGGARSAQMRQGALPGSALALGGAPIEDHVATIYVLHGKSPAPRPVRTGLSDGSFTAIYPVDGSLKEGDPVVTGVVNAPLSPTSMPPGMGRRRF